LASSSVAFHSSTRRPAVSPNRRHAAPLLIAALVARFDLRAGERAHAILAAPSQRPGVDAAREAAHLMKTALLPTGKAFVA
jgi:hypothetical protein